MELRRQRVARVLLGAVLIVCAAFVAVFVRNALEQRNPENALPTMQLSFTTPNGTTPLPANIVRMDTYDWTFLFWRRTGGGKDTELWREIEPSLVDPYSEIDFIFTFEPRSYKVFIRAEESSWSEYEARPLVMPEAQTVKTEYTIRVEANWGEGKDVTYYAKLALPDWL